MCSATGIEPVRLSTQEELDACVYPRTLEYSISTFDGMTYALMFRNMTGRQSEKQKQQGVRLVNQNKISSFHVHKTAGLQYPGSC
mmetsp:Transcript_110675/g.191845  ORF Transcript_110675/g.191845 Transcript_110675/m.191845 type:complete len:85 (+) Transcript_110675:631-885(+)